MSEWLEKLSKRGINVDNERQRQIDKHNAQHVLNQLVKMTAERDSLRAAADVVCKHLDDDGVRTSGLVGSIKALKAVTDISPADNCHIRQIQADSGRAGFVACGAWLSNEDDGRHTVAEAADEYAERVKAGEV